MSSDFKEKQKLIGAFFIGKGQQPTSFSLPTSNRSSRNTINNPLNENINRASIKPPIPPKPTSIRITRIVSQNEP